MTALLCFLAMLARAEETGDRPLTPAALPGLLYTNAFFPEAAYHPAISTLENLLGRPVGNRAALPAEIERCLAAWAKESDRTRLVEYARSHENRPLYYMVVTARKNLARLDEIKSAMARLGDPRQTSKAEAETLIESLPAIGWLSYTIHGDETEGSDAALAVLYHLVAGTDAPTEKLLEDLVIIVDPLMNPDGRERFLKMVAEHRGASPNVDDRSLLHEGYWPWGRGNHYLFDLNRDSIYAVHPETQGRLRAIAAWNPLLYVDAHGMGAQDTHLFSPPREPINLNIPAGRRAWNRVFARDQAKAFDQRGWLYYHGEWNEDWYAGYTDGWAAYRGAVGILYEQARIAQDGVRRPEGRILSYRESVHHHVTGSMANLRTLQANAKSLLRDFYADRAASVSLEGPYARRTFAILPTANGGRLNQFIQTMRGQGFEMYTAIQPITVASARDRLGREVKNVTLPPSTLLLPNRQPLGRLLAALLEFDPKIPEQSLVEEYQELLRKGASRIYDVTAWNHTMMYDLEAFELASDLPEPARLFTGEVLRRLEPVPVARPVAYIIDGADDRSVSAAARLMERGVEVRVAEKPFTLDGRDFSRGSVVVTTLDNRNLKGALSNRVARVTGELDVTAVPIASGFGEGDLPDLGGGHFTRLQPPRIGLFSRGGVSPNDYGAIWHLLDHRLGIRHSHLENTEGGQELARYNVLILPEGTRTPAGFLKELAQWTRSGGTLIAIGGAAAALADPKSEFSRVRLLPEVLDNLGEFELALTREWLAQKTSPPALAKIWSNKALTNLTYSWPSGDGDRPDVKELKKRDHWQQLFMPQGAFIASRVDIKHWLTAGCAAMMPVLAGSQPILMAGEGIEAPIRYGFLVPVEKTDSPTNRVEAVRTAKGTNTVADAKAEAGEGKKDKPEVPRVGWAALPDGYEMYLRMSGLLWPEAAQRLANAAVVTRESMGSGQVILFAEPPNFRAATLGQARVFLNALVYGPGFGAVQPIQP